MFVKLLIITSIVACASCLECYIHQPASHTQPEYSGFESNAQFKYCAYSPSMGEKKYVASGHTDETEYMAIYTSVFHSPDDSIFKIDHLCFREKYYFGKGEPTPLFRCLCDYDRCNIKENAPPHMSPYMEDTVM